LTSAELAFFQAGLATFLEVEAVKDGLGPLTPEERSALARRAAVARWRKRRAKPKRRRS